MPGFDLQLDLPDNGDNASGVAVEDEVAGSGHNMSQKLDYNVYVSYTHAKSSLVFFNGADTYDHSGTGTLDLEASIYPLDFLFQRMTHIAQGNEYYTPADCLFTLKSDLRVRIHQPRDTEEFGDLNVGQPAQSQLATAPTSTCSR